MDCRMPIMDGAAVTREIRMVEKAGGMARVPIVALTATPTEEERQDCFEAGMDGFLMKPFSDQQLLQTIRVYVENAALARIS